jgi:hypothetical protein
MPIVAMFSVHFATKMQGREELATRQTSFLPQEYTRKRRMRSSRQISSFLAFHFCHKNATHGEEDVNS